jgi:hypothetical protein
LLTNAKINQAGNALSIAAKDFHAGFYWLTAIKDAKDIVQRCEAYQ